jgi:glycosyltransferase involved in cell wall biosynthesis
MEAGAMLDRITPLVLTYNEEPNIRRLLERLSWATRVVIVDSGSTDATLRIVSEFGNSRLFVRKFDTHAAQWNYGLAETGIDTGWVLALDADYGLTDAFLAEIAQLDPGPSVSGYRARFRYCIDGIPLRGGAYPPVTVLFRRQAARYLQDGHTQRICLEGDTLTLAQPLLHDDRKSLERWFAAQIDYMRQEADKLVATPMAELSIPDRIRRLIVLAPVLMFIYCLILKGGLLDGRRGIFYAMQRSVAEAILSAFLVDAGIRQGRTSER